MAMFSASLRLLCLGISQVPENRASSAHACATLALAISPHLLALIYNHIFKAQKCVVLTQQSPKATVCVPSCMLCCPLTPQQAQMRGHWASLRGVTSGGRGGGPGE